jgi:hypothetical protein
VDADFVCKREAVGITAPDALAELRIADGDGLAERGAAFGSLGGAEERVEAGPLGGQVIVFGFELATDGAEGIGGNASVEGTGALGVRHYLLVKEALYRGEEFVVGGTGSHVNCQLSVVNIVRKGRRLV